MVKRNSGIIGPKQSVSTGSAKGCHESFDQYNAEKGGNWPSIVLPGTDTTTSFYGGLPTRTYYDSSSSDYTGPFDCQEVQTSFSGTGRLYIGIKVTNSTTYYNDISVGGIQILSADKSTINQSWFFTSSSGGTGSGWQTYTNQITGSSAYGFPVSPSTASGYTYVNMSSSTNIARFSWATGTNSYQTGTAGGISSTSWTSTLMTLGNGQISQVGSNYYAFRETSGSTRYSGVVMRSPSRTWVGSEWIRIAFLIVSPSSPATNYADSLFVGTY